MYVRVPKLRVTLVLRRLGSSFAAGKAAHSGVSRAASFASLRSEWLMYRHDSCTTYLCRQAGTAFGQKAQAKHKLLLLRGPDQARERSTLDRSLTPLIFPTTARRVPYRASVLQAASLAICAIAKRGALSAPCSTAAPGAYSFRPITAAAAALDTLQYTAPPSLHKQHAVAQPCPPRASTSPQGKP